MSLRNLLAPALTIAAAAAAWAADRTAARTRPAGERGDLWVRVTWQTAGIGAAMAITTMMQSFPAFWRTGLHPHLDLVLGSWWAFPVALAIPFAAWGVILAAAVGAAPSARSLSSWLAGTVGYATRNWVLLCGLPLLVPLIGVGRSRLDSGAEGYPAGTWGTLAVLLISLFFLARSAGISSPVEQQERIAQDAKVSATELKPWPAAMADEGIALQPVAVFNAQPVRREAAQRASDLERKLEAMGARHASPEVIETVHDLLRRPAGETGKAAYRLLFAPDESGQIEVVAAAACEIASTSRECTLVVSRHLDRAFARRFERWAHASGPGRQQLAVLTVDGETNLTASPGIWLVDAATLSDHFLARLADRAVVSRIGLVVWWDIHEYTGVLAANIWAISRRLHRLVVALGKPDVRTLALVRETFHPGSNMGSFVRWLLPYPFPAEHEVHVEGRGTRSIHIHSLGSQKAFFDRNQANSIPSRVRHPELVAALVSISHGWPTSLSAHSQIPDSERREVIGRWVHGASIGEALRDEVSESGARIMHLDEADILAVREIACQGGRASAASVPHHVAITLPDNPYAVWVIGRLAGGAGINSSRRLVGAEGHPAVFRRHLLLALSEQMDTRTGLMETLLWQEEVVEKTLKEIAEQGKLSHQRVAFIADGARQIEYLYRSSLPRDREKRPLDTVGDATILVRPATEDMQPLRVDEARLAIRAYPGRIFVENGTRYRVRDWGHEERGWIECQRTDEPARTWRIRTPQVKRMQPKGEERTTSEPGLLVKYYPVSLRYEEDVSGYIRRDYDFYNGEHKDQRHRIPPLLTEFDTSGFVMDFAPEPERAAIHALCQTLRHVLPVHLGVEEDAVEIVPLEGDYVGRRQVFGLVIVDLYPQGIGLVEAIGDDPAWTTEIMRLMRDWLADVVPDASKRNPFLSPMAKAATGGGEDPRPGLDLLRRVVGPEHKSAGRPAKGGI